MNNPIQREPEIQPLNRRKSFTAPPKVQTTEGIRLSIKDPDTMLSMTVLLIACLALAVLAHVFV
jgi:hypothetical protein